MARRGFEVEGAQQVAKDWSGSVVLIADGDLRQAADRDARIGVGLQAMVGTARRGSNKVA